MLQEYHQSFKVTVPCAAQQHGTSAQQALLTGSWTMGEQKAHQVTWGAHLSWERAQGTRSSITWLVLRSCSATKHVLQRGHYAVRYHQWQSLDLPKQACLGSLRGWPRHALSARLEPVELGRFRNIPTWHALPGPRAKPAAWRSTRHGA
jgi:hypothetical protein